MEKVPKEEWREGAERWCRLKRGEDMEEEEAREDAVEVGVARR